MDLEGDQKTNNVPICNFKSNKLSLLDKRQRMMEAQNII